MNLHSLIVSILPIVTLTGCFTGIESTPTITESDVKRSHVDVPTPEDSYLASVTPESIDAFRPGKQWIVTDSKVNMIFGASGPGTTTTGLNAQKTLNAGDTIAFSHINESTAIDGRRLAQLVFTHSGDTLVYRTALTMADATKPGATVDVPFAVQRSVVDTARSIMQGQLYYIVTTSRYNLANQPYIGRRFVTVKVDSVSHGNSYYPIALRLTDDRGEQFRLYMSDGAQGRAEMPRKFRSLLSLSNPRLRYPTITDTNWTLIVDGRVAEGMTRDECRLALGQPANVDRQPGYSYLREMWTYDGGQYLIFEDGLLKSFRL